MTYLLKEQSVYDSNPIEFYEFVRGGTRHHFTSSDKDTYYNGIKYIATPMERTALEYSGELGRAGIKITLPRDVEFLKEYLVTPPSEVTTLTVYRKHFTEGDTEGVVIWMGRLLNLSWEESVVTLECEPVFTSIMRLGLRKQFGRTCPHALYSASCGANNTVFRIESTIIGLSSKTVSVAGASAKPNGYFAGGYAQWDYNGTLERKMIVSHVSDTMTLSGVPRGVVGGQTITIFAGCDHTLSTCANKFNNSLNYGGFPWIPIKNPFASIALW